MCAIVKVAHESGKADHLGGPMLKSLPAHMRIGMALLCVLFHGAAWPMDDVLDRPATVSQRATQSLLLAMARVGPRIVAVGERGIVLLSDDDGRSWRQARVPVSVTLTNVHLLDARSGWITGHGGTLLRTEDGGETWTRRLEGTGLAKLILDAELAKGEAATPASIAEAQRLVSDGADKPLLDVRFLSPHVGFVVGAYGIVLRTQDGGTTWTPWQDHLPNPQGRHLYRIAVANDDIYVVGEQGAAFLSTDSGETFKGLKSPYRGTFFGVVAVSAHDVLIYGMRGNAFRVSGRGADWSKVDISIPASFSASVRLSSGATVIASQTGDLLRSLDGGKSFAPIQMQNRSLISALEEASDGALMIAGRGISRLALPTSAGGSQ